MNKMRMWCVEPKGMCRKHLLGEHIEMTVSIGLIDMSLIKDGDQKFYQAYMLGEKRLLSQ